MAYCEQEDLLVGQILTRLPPQISVADMIQGASDEIDSKLGFIYVVPFIDPVDEAPPTGLLPHQYKLIKDICVKLASGRIIMAATSASESSTVHAYGYNMVQEALNSLMCVANGDVRLNATRVDAAGNPVTNAPSPIDNDPFAFIPGGSNRDAVSGVSAFEDNFMRPDGLPYPETTTWIPGA